MEVVVVLGGDGLRVHVLVGVWGVGVEGYVRIWGWCALNLSILVW